MQDLIDSYKATRSGLRALLSETDCKSDREIITRMISNMTWTIARMESGSYPRRQRAIERQSKEQRTLYLENKVLEALANQHKLRSSSTITNEDRRIIDEALNRLTERERDCFVAVYGSALSFSEAADILGISKSSVGTYIARAKKKLITNRFGFVGSGIMEVI